MTGHSTGLMTGQGLSGQFLREIEEMKERIPTASLERLPQYMRVLITLESEGQIYVTSAELARTLRLDETLVRKDIALTGFTGKPRVGFAVAGLLGHLERFLDLHSTKKAFVIGAGRLGQALATYPGFERYGLRIVALFDTDKNKIGQVVGGRAIQPLSIVPAMARRMEVRIAILTVPAEVAQEVAEMLVQAGFSAFWNFSGQPLSLPEGIVVRDEDLAKSLALLSHELALRLSVQQDDAPEGAGALSPSA